MNKADPRLILFFGVLMSSFSAIIAHYSDAPSLVIVTFRLLWTVGLMLPMVLLRRRSELRQLSRHNVLVCAASGFLLALHFYAWFESLKWTSVATSTVLVSTEAIFSALGFALFLKGKIPRLGAAGITVAFGGIALLAFSEHGAAAGSVRGDLLALVGAVFVSAYTLIGRVQRGHLSTMIYTFLTYTACLVTLLLLDIITATPLTGWDVSAPVTGLLLAVCCTLLGHSIFSWSLKWLSPSYVSAVKLCGPVCAAVLALILLGESLRLLQAVGGLITLLGALLYTHAEGKISACNLESAEL